MAQQWYHFGSQRRFWLLTLYFESFPNNDGQWACHVEAMAMEWMWTKKASVWGSLMSRIEWLTLEGEIVV
jgi:hypothetical protein